MYNVYIVYISDMSKGITKIQLAVSVAKGKLIVLKQLREMNGAVIHDCGRRIDHVVHHSTLDELIKQQEHEIKEIEGNTPSYREMQQNGLISE